MGVRWRWTRRRDATVSARRVLKPERSEPCGITSKSCGPTEVWADADCGGKASSRCARRTARGACRACERARAASGMPVLASAVPNALFILRLQDGKAVRIGSISSSGTTWARAQTARREDVQCERRAQEGDSPRSPARVPIFLLLRSPPRPLTLRPSVPRRRSWSSTKFRTGSPHNGKLLRARPHARPVYLRHAHSSIPWHALRDHLALLEPHSPCF
jgi:hypothetical protein